MLLPHSWLRQITLPNDLEAVLAVSAVAGTSTRGVLNPQVVTSSQGDLWRGNLAQEVLPLVHKVLIHGFGFLHEIVFLRVGIPPVPEGGQEALTLRELSPLGWQLVMPIVEVR